MKIGIIVAMQEELDSITNTLNIQYTKHQHGVFTVYEVNYLSHTITFILSGIGKVNAALHTQYVIDKISPDCIINVGVAGSLSENLKFGDVVVATDLVHHDMDVSAFNLPLGQVPRMDVFSFQSCEKLLNKVSTIKTSDYTIQNGRVVSGDQFIHTRATAQFLANNFQAIACEMEGVAVAQTCFINKIPFLIIRALSDMAGFDTNATYSYAELKDMAANRASFFVTQVLPLI
jgi:adenosylhomocysteine nucleosidase